MTREEVIDWLCRLRRFLIYAGTPNEWRSNFDQALASAIKALEQEPCDDAISRQAVLDQTYLWSKDEFLRITNPFDYLRKRINSLPPVTPQPKIGRWISFGTKGEIDGQIVQAFTCSECGAISIFRMSNWNIVNGDLCPNCGAKM